MAVSARKASAIVLGVTVLAIALIITVLVLVSRPGTISGTVLGANGTPMLANEHGNYGTVHFYRNESGNLIESETSANIEADGSYTTYELPPGNYTINIVPRDGVHAETWWDGQAEQSQAKAVRVSSGEHLTGMDMQVKKGASISGHLTKSDGEPLSLDEDGTFGTVTAYRLNAKGFRSFDSPTRASISADGSYTIGALKAGDYRIHFEPSSTNTTHVSMWWGNDPDEYESKTLTLAYEELHTNIDARLPQGASISGTVTTTDGESLSTISSRVKNEVTANRVLPNGEITHAADGVIAADGTYTITPLPPGKYKIYFALSNNSSHLRQWWSKASDRDTAKIVTVAEGELVRNINALVEPSSSISGTVTDKRGKPLPPSDQTELNRVTAYRLGSDGQYEWTEQSPLANDGTYKIGPLPAGTYKILFKLDHRGRAKEAWWGNTKSQESAEKLTLKKQEQRINIDFTMR